MRNESNMQRYFLAVAMLIIGIAAALLFMTFTELGKTTDEVRRTSAYTRVTNCILGKSANPPMTQTEIEKCYAQVEKNTKIELERFDYQTAE